MIIPYLKSQMLAQYRGVTERKREELEKRNSFRSTCGPVPSWIHVQTGSSCFMTSLANLVSHVRNEDDVDYQIFQDVHREFFPGGKGANSYTKMRDAVVEYAEREGLRWLERMMDRFVVLDQEDAAAKVDFLVSQRIPFLYGASSHAYCVFFSDDQRLAEGEVCAVNGEGGWGNPLTKTKTSTIKKHAEGWEIAYFE